MNELRWILLGIGAVLLLLIYLFSRRSPGADSDEAAAMDRQAPSLRMEAEPTVGPEGREYDTLDDTAGVAESRFAPAPDGAPTEAPQSADIGVTDTPAASDDAGEPDPMRDTEHAAAPVVPEKVIALHLMPMAGQVFEGIEFIGAIQAERLKFGRFDIFHRFADPDTATDKTPASFSLANIIKPGTFNLQDLDRQQFKGASLFLVLPGPEDAVAAFADMLATGRRLAATLDGQLLDAQGTALSRQSASHLREDIINYQHGLSAAPVE